MPVFNNHGIFVFLLWLLLVQGQELEKTYSKTPTIKNFYLSLDYTNFFEAFVHCKQGGMKLASIENEDDSAALDTFLDPYKIAGTANGFWLSGTNLINTSINQYYWLSTGERAIFTNWFPGQPDDLNGQEHCLEWIYINGTEITTGTGWNDEPCNSVLRYVCEYVSN